MYFSRHLKKGTAYIISFSFYSFSFKFSVFGYNII